MRFSSLPEEIKTKNLVGAMSLYKMWVPSHLFNYKYYYTHMYSNSHFSCAWNLVEAEYKAESGDSVPYPTQV